MRVAAAILSVLFLLGLTACGDKGKSSAPTTGPGPATTPTGETQPTTTESTITAPPPVTTIESEIPNQPVGAKGKIAAAKYRAYLRKRAKILDEQTAVFVKALRRGDPETAVKTYARLRASYERLQPIAVRLGLEADMNAREGSVEQSDWRGFHPIEKQIFDVGTTEGMGKIGDELAADTTEIRAGIKTLDITPSLVLTDLNVALARAGTNMAPEEEPYSLENLSAASGNTKTAKATWAVLRPVVAASDKKLAKEIDEAIESVYITVESMLRPGIGYRRYDDIGPNDISAIVNAADAARAALIPAEQYLSN
jgi:iron uptake system component EfeO